MTDFIWHSKIVEESLLLDIEEAKQKYGNYIRIEDGALQNVSNWLNGYLEYNVDFIYLMDFENNHHIYFKSIDKLFWFLLSNNLTNYTVHIQ